MWNGETIKKKVDEGLLPCARCHKWKDTDKFKKGMKTCKECLETSEAALAAKKEREATLAAKKEDCVIS